MPLRGQERIGVEFFEGSDADAFLRAVEVNVTHGRPLSLADRRAAAARIIASHPHLSTRAIARASGLSAKAVGALRRCSTDAEQQLDKRVGRDGRARPVNVMEGRWRAAQVMAENPNASLREIARLAGISPPPPATYANASWPVSRPWPVRAGGRDPHRRTGGDPADLRPQPAVRPGAGTAQPRPGNSRTTPARNRYWAS